MLAKLNIESRVAVYVQIENQVRFAIASGKLKADDRLPSVRELSERLDVNPNTVTKAYHDLEVMGLVYTRRSRGVFIDNGVQDTCREACWSQIAGRLHETIMEAKAAGFSANDVSGVVKKSLSIDAPPYAPTPSEILPPVRDEKMGGK